MLALSHDLPLDAAVSVAATAAGTSVPVLFADPTLLRVARLSAVADRYRHRLSRYVGAQHRRMDWPVDEGKFLGVGTAPGPPITPEALLDKLSQVEFDRESSGATLLSSISRQAAEAIEPPLQRRFLQTKVDAVTDDGVVDARRAFVAGSLHLVQVWIGELQADAIPASEPITEPPFPGAQPLAVTVVFVEPRLLSEPAVRELVLPPEGMSTSCTFELDVPRSTTGVRARIVVLHENRVLQTAVLQGQALTPGQDPGDAPELTLTVEIVRARTEDLDARREFDAAIVANHDDDGHDEVTLISGQRVELLEPDEFKVAVSAIRGILEEAVLDENGYDGLRETRTVEMLCRLAHFGRLLHRHIKRHCDGGVIVPEAYLQLVSAREGAYFPLEFAYDREAPELDAELCPNAVDGLLDGSCSAECPVASDARFVCPLGFWGLSRVIERQPFRGSVAPAWEHAILGEPSSNSASLGIPLGAVFAASTRVDLGEPHRGHIASVLDELRNASAPAEQAADWAQWRQHVKDNAPALLVLLPHTTPHSMLSPLPALEIGDSEQVATSQFNEAYVGASVHHRPLVILLGCSTAAGPVAFERFPASFLEFGAGEVLATITKVLGRHAAPVAIQTVKLLAARAASGQAYFGELVRDLRRTLLAQGNPFGLTLVVYGDADWQFGAEAA